MHIESISLSEPLQTLRAPHPASPCLGTGPIDGLFGTCPPSLERDLRAEALNIARNATAFIPVPPRPATRGLTRWA